ncbi:MAG: hypothetical protein WCP32_03280 [Bacteroidota bacterium]
MRKICILIIALSLLMHFNLFAQNQSSGSKKSGKKTDKRHNFQEQEEPEEKDSVRRWEFGLNFGVYFANKYSANFYNGSEYNVNKLTSVMSNESWNKNRYDEIKRALGMGASDEVLIDGYPLNMHYSVAFTGGLFLRFNFDRKNGIFLQANYTRLNAGDIVVLDIIPPKTGLQDLRYQPIIGREGRVMIDLGYQRSFPLRSKIYFFVQAAGTMCYTQVLKSVFVVEGTEYSIIDNRDYTTGQTYYQNQNAFGFGGFIGVGAGIPLTDMFGLEPGFFMQYYPVNLQGYPEYKPSFGISLRILLSFSQSGS